MRIRTSPAPAQLSDSDKKQQYHYEVEFIFGTSEARIFDLRKNLHQDLPLDEPATEENYLREFEHICAAMLEAAVASDNDRVLCTTFPEGARRIENAKYLSGIFGQGGKPH
jgi:hypothetical protein